MQQFWRERSLKFRKINSWDTFESTQLTAWVQKTNYNCTWRLRIVVASGAVFSAAAVLGEFEFGRGGTLVVRYLMQEYDWAWSYGPTRLKSFGNWCELESGCGCRLKALLGMQFRNMHLVCLFNKTKVSVVQCGCVFWRRTSFQLLGLTLGLNRCRADAGAGSMGLWLGLNRHGAGDLGPNRRP